MSKNQGGAQRAENAAVATGPAEGATGGTGPTPPAAPKRKELRIAPGKSITSSRGILDAGTVVTEGDFAPLAGPEASKRAQELLTAGILEES